MVALTALSHHKPPPFEIIWEVSGQDLCSASVLASRFLLPELSFQLLDAGCDWWPAEEIVSRSVQVIASVWLSVVLEDGSWDIAAIVIDVIETDPAMHEESTELVQALVVQVEERLQDPGGILVILLVTGCALLLLMLVLCVGNSAVG